MINKIAHRLRLIAYGFLAVSCLLCAVSPALSQSVAPDPTRLAVGGRILGMGKAYIGLADDVSSIYANPAGLGNLNQWQMTSMSGTFMEDYSYINLAGAYPTNLGVFGIGFTSSSVGGGYATKKVEGSDPLDPVYEIDTSQPMINYYNNVSILSYGNKLQNLRLPFKFPFETLFGASLKLFFSGLSGDGITQGNASGNELNLGMTMKLNPWLTYGSCVQNILPVSMGGKLTYASGHYEYYPALWQNGVSLKILGDENAIRKLAGQDLKFLFDFDYYPTRPGYPIIYHTGFEWLPIKLISLRAGIDQDAAGDGTGTVLNPISNLTAGIGINYANFNFDYAYHAFAGAPGTTNQFFSLSYSPSLPKVEEAKFSGKIVDISDPMDKTITFDDKLLLTGKINDFTVQSLKLNGNTIKFDLKGNFEMSVELKNGKNMIDVTAFDKAGKQIYQEKIKILRLVVFPDVPMNYWVAQPISFLSMQNIVTGYADGSFKPEGNITRAEMCTLLMKTLGQQSEPSAKFSDVSRTHWAATYISKAAELGVVKGYKNGTFMPSANISRAEGVAMIARFANITDESYSNQFADITDDHWISKTVAGAYNAGILKFLEGKAFEPNRKLTRAETVEMLNKTKVVQDALNKGLLDWGSY